MSSDLQALLDEAVPEPPVYLDPAQVLSRARRRSAANNSLAGLLALVAVLGVGASIVMPNNSDEARYANPAAGVHGEAVTRRDLVEESMRGSDQPIALPTEVPAGYSLVFAPGNFMPPPGRTAIDVCTLPLDADPVGTCVGTRDAERPRFSTTTGDGKWQVIVQAVSAPYSPDDLEPWEELRYTTDLASIRWLDERLTKEEPWWQDIRLMIGIAAALMLALMARRHFGER